MYIKDTLEGTFEQVKSYLEHDIQTEGSEWMRTANEYRRELNISWEEFRDIDRKGLKKQIRDMDTQQWMEEMLNKPTLKWYREVKLYIGYDSCYRNNRNSEYLVKARTNSLQVEEHLGRGKRNYNKTCKLCSQEGEDLENTS